MGIRTEPSGRLSSPDRLRWLSEEGGGRKKFFRLSMAVSMLFIIGEIVGKEIDFFFQRREFSNSMRVTVITVRELHELTRQSTVR